MVGKKLSCTQLRSFIALGTVVEIHGRFVRDWSLTSIITVLFFSLNRYSDILRESTSTPLLAQQKFLLAPPFFFQARFDHFQEQAATSSPLLNIPLLLSCGPILKLPFASIRLPSVNRIGRLLFFKHSTQGILMVRRLILLSAHKNS